MTADALYRTAGAGLAAGGIAAALGEAAEDFVTADAHSWLVIGGSAATGIGSILVAMCLAAVVGRQSPRTGPLGLIGYALLAVGVLVIGVYANFNNAFVGPNLPDALVANWPLPLTLLIAVASLAEIAGLALLGVAIVRARVFPAALGWTLVGAAVLAAASFLPFPDMHYAAAVAVVAAYGALAGLGAALWRRPAFSAATAGGPLLAGAGE